VNLYFCGTKEDVMKTLTVPALLAILAVTSPPVLAVDAKRAQYVGGTAAGVKLKAEGTFSISDETAARFDASKDGRLDIPYDAITALEYGPKPGGHAGSVPTRKSTHYLTISYTDAAGKELTAVFELGRGIVQTTLKALELHAGKDVMYQNDDARKAAMDSKE
jgi:hypothetical protein